MADVDGRFRRTAPDADRHQHGLDPVVTKTVWPADLVQHHVLRTPARLDHLVVPSPADSQHALEHQKVFDNLMEMVSGVFADRLVHQAQAELPWFERARIAGFGGTAGTDVPHLGAL